jgi:hypothetical protein
MITSHQRQKNWRQKHPFSVFDFCRVMKPLVFAPLLLLATTASAAELFAAPHGDDRAAGPMAQPFAHGGTPNSGFFIDEGSKGFHFESNFVHTASGGAIRFNQNHREAHTWLGNSFDAAATPDLISATQNNAGLEPAFAHLESTRTAAAKASGE